ncbi:MAG: sigma-54-dependent Fis family transcriptional regulator, partial [Gemmatimonadetes bacterium]|nr:sigma-54-dependent Fis family transcriptional regulator [Gemmatimonadota bacterium]
VGGAADQRADVSMDRSAPDLATRRPADPPTRLSEAIDQAERDAIQRALAAAQGNRSEAAKTLGISVRNLFYKMKRLEI